MSKARLKRLSLKSPAKLNLYLKILNKRKDGFHNLQTVFEKIALCDRLTLKENLSGRINIFSSSLDCPSDRTNLAYRAAALLKKAAGVKSGVDITIEKNIPVESGLGGGSSNAAVVLKGLNRLWGLGLSRKELLGLAEKLGSDVSFFIYDDSFALGEGRGERIVPLKGVKPFWHIIIVPKVKISTVEAYRRFDQGRAKAPDTKILTKAGCDVNILIRALREHDLVLTSKCLFNDFSRDLLYRHPGIPETKHALEELTGREASVTGKGPVIFSLVYSAKEAGYLKIKLARSRDEKVLVVKTF